MNPNEASANKTINITTNGTTIVPGKCVLLLFVVGTSGTSSVATIYDSNAAIGANVEKKKARITTAANRNIPLRTFMENGIYVVTTGSPAADITIVYATTP